MSVAELLDGKRVCVCGGSGGVGKTTTSAAIALGMAAAARKVAVVTIDPARRLANALGLQELENEPCASSPSALPRPALEVKGELWAMMLDPKRTFDELIDRVAPDPERATEIKYNRVYRELSTAVSGSQEFTAIAKLYELDREGDFDLLVLDTPPSRNALDFLDAPGRLTSFLEGRALKTFIRPTGLGMRVLGPRRRRRSWARCGASPASTCSRDLSTFFGLLGDMTDEFCARAAQVEAMLKAPTTAFRAGHLRPAGRDRRGDLVPAHVAGQRAAVRGRDRQPRPPRRARRACRRRGPADALSGELPTGLADGSRNFEDYHVLARRDWRSLRGWTTSSVTARCSWSPSSTTTYTTSPGCCAIHRFLFASDAEREQLIADVVAG